MDLGLTGKIAFVTGASKGIGRAVAEQLASEGADIVITARTAGPLAQVASDIAARTGRTNVALAGDMSNAEDVDRGVKETLGRVGHIANLVTCPRSAAGGP